MVKSGLGENRRGDRNEIRVSPYRLSAHLGMAFATYSTLLWTGLGILQLPNDTLLPQQMSNASKNKKALSRLEEVARSLTKQSMKHAILMRNGAIFVTSLTGLTVLSGAFVAGNDAGCAYNTYPKMDGKWMPLEDMIDNELKPLYRNLFENTATVQWNHRVLGTSTALSAVGLAGYGLSSARSGAVTPQVRRGLQVLGGVAVGQMSLGIATLLNYVPINLAAAHQVGSMVVLTSGLYVVHSLRYSSPSVLRAIGRVVTGSGHGGFSSGVRTIGSHTAVAAGPSISRNISGVARNSQK